MRISEVYRPMVLTCRATDSLTAVARRMAAEQVGALPVVDSEARVVGIISERDLTRALAEEADVQARTAVQYATKELDIALLDDDTYAVARRMLDGGVRHLPVVEDSQVVGMVSMRDLLAVETWA